MQNLTTQFLNLVMQLVALQQARADRHERTETSREKPVETQAFGKYARVEKALVNAIAESYLQGLSTPKVGAIIPHLGIDELSPSSVSRIAQDLDRNTGVPGETGRTANPVSLPRCPVPHRR